jgi:hypothetical protein
MITRIKKEKITGYIPMVENMTLNCVAACISVMHHNRGIVQTISVDPTQFMPVCIRYWLPVWEEVAILDVAEEAQAAAA